MKQLEQERDVLIQGLESVDRARNWYQQQLADVKDKQRNVHTGQLTRMEVRESFGESATVKTCNGSRFQIWQIPIK